MMRWAVLAPMPGTLEIIATSSAATAAAKSSGVSVESAASATLGPTPLTVISSSKALFSARLSKPNSESSSSRT